MSSLCFQFAATVKSAGESSGCCCCGNFWPFLLTSACKQPASFFSGLRFSCGLCRLQEFAAAHPRNHPLSKNKFTNVAALAPVEGEAKVHSGPVKIAQ